MNPTLWSAVRSEWTKFRTVRSTIAGFVTFVGLTIGIGILITIAVGIDFVDHGRVGRAAFNATATSLGGVNLAQFAVGTIGILMVTAEYACGSMRTTLAAVPRRGRLVAAKALVLVASLLVICEATVFAAFSIGQSIYRSAHIAATFSQPGVTRAVLAAGLYLALLGLFGMGLGLILRTTAMSIVVYTSVLLIIPIVANFLPASWQSNFNKFLPLNLGRAMFTPTAITDSFSWLTATGLLVGYVVIVMGIGTLLLARRDG